MMDEEKEMKDRKKNKGEQYTGKDVIQDNNGKREDGWEK